ncbi:hypothetical protein [Cellulosimicrobium sp. NPDC057127]|uniref:hypothetical protein n=1 Tax=Cellulosimicrobium sp. NPDC057127 TaxID=3346026 RepID=UPI00363CC1BA
MPTRARKRTSIALVLGLLLACLIAAVLAGSYLAGRHQDWPVSGEVVDKGMQPASEDVDASVVRAPSFHTVTLVRDGTTTTYCTYRDTWSALRVGDVVEDLDTLDC